MCDYGSLSESQRLARLTAQIADHRPLVPTDIDGFSEATRETITTFRTLRKALRGRHRGAVRTYIVSGTEGPADLLEVLLLAKEASLARAGGEGARCGSCRCSRPGRRSPVRLRRCGR